MYILPHNFPQINRPPVKLTLLTCQVRPNPEEKKCFDLVTREWSLPLPRLFSQRPVRSRRLPSGPVSTSTRVYKWLLLQA